MKYRYVMVVGDIENESGLIEEALLLKLLLLIDGDWQTVTEIPILLSDLKKIATGMLTVAELHDIESASSTTH